VNDALVRQEILARFEAWLDAVLTSDEPPAGIDAEILAAASNGDAPPEGVLPADDYQLWSALTALTQESKLQGRAFQDLARLLEAQPKSLAAEMSESARQREREIESRVRRETERRCLKEALEILIDLDDRLARGLESARASQERAGAKPRAFFERLFVKPDTSRDEIAGAVVRGYELAIERIEHAFERLNAHRIRCLGEPFDPRTMNAVDREESTAAQEGSVLEVYRGGYEWNGEVLRPAQVKVACLPSSAAADEATNPRETEHA
jgi:GrpE